MPLKKNPSLKVFFITAEADPFIKVGGLGDYAGSLPKALLNTDPALLDGYTLDLRLAIPFHSAINPKKFNLRQLGKVGIQFNKKILSLDIFFTKVNGLIIYLIKNHLYFNDNEPVYSSDQLHNRIKYTIFSLACLELAKQLKWQVDILHANDWHTSLAIVKIKQQKKRESFFKDTRTVLSVHNMGYMGGSHKYLLKEFGLKPVAHPQIPTWAKDQPMPMGLILSDLIIAVSPTYAKEIQTSKFGYGMERFLRTRKQSITGILNGIDYQKWNPKTDMCVVKSYSVETINDRRINKNDLQKSLCLEANPSIPLIAIISRLDFQKGIDLAIKAMVRMRELPWQLVILGTGSQELENLCQKFAKNNPDRVRTLISYNDKIARQMYASADMILIPSRYEPCGTTQMIAMRYGCLPLARATGGLKDSIKHLSNGFLFVKSTTNSLILAITDALYLFINNPRHWRKMQDNAMRKDFTWTISAKEYLLNYLRLMN